MAEERGTNGDILVMQIPDTMDNGRTHFKDRGSYILLTVQSQFIEIESSHLMQGVAIAIAFFHTEMGQNSQYSSLLDSEHMSQELKG